MRGESRERAFRTRRVKGFGLACLIPCHRRLALVPGRRASGTAFGASSKSRTSDRQSLLGTSIHRQCGTGTGSSTETARARSG